jgi:tryptophanyl-tRNA synthetase
VGTGLLIYPVLQASDILLYKPDYVPVGEDQKQHLELTRDIAARFNFLYGDYFKLPEPLIRPTGARIMGLDDPDSKMSKSLAETRPAHAVALLDPPDVIRKKVMSAVTDSGRETRFAQASAGVKNLLTIYEVMSGRPMAEVEARFAGQGYGVLKKDLAELIAEKLRPLQERYRDITADPSTIERILQDGAERARAVADATVRDVRRLAGLPAAAP